MTLATIAQDKAAGGVARRKIRIKNGGVVTASLAIRMTIYAVIVPSSDSNLD